MKNKEEIIERIKELEYKLRLLDTVVNDHEGVQRTKLQINILKWVISE